MARGSLSKIRWANDRQRKFKARALRKRAAGRQPAASSPAVVAATPPEGAHQGV